MNTKKYAVSSFKDGEITNHCLHTTDKRHLDTNCGDIQCRIERGEQVTIQLPTNVTIHFSGVAGGLKATVTDFSKEEPLFATETALYGMESVYTQKPIARTEDGENFLSKLLATYA